MKIFLISFLFLLVNLSEFGFCGWQKNPTGGISSAVKIDDSPVCSITNPTEEDIFYVGGMISFVVECTVLEYSYGRVLREWSSDLDGQIGSGVSISKNTLSEGTHQITVTVTDGRGAVGRDTIVITINPTTDIGTKKRELPDTGQTTSYTEIFGEDSNYTINPPTYTKLDSSGQELDKNAPDWIMVRDNVTSLVWENKTVDGGINDKGNRYTWQEAHGFIEQLNSANFGGYSDWRLPTIKELSTIVDSEVFRPAINMFYFPNIGGSNYTFLPYWSSTPTAYASNEAWYVSFPDGSVRGGSTKSYDQFVRAVRGSLPPPSNFVDNGDNTVTDNTTKLMWQRGKSIDYMTWEEALVHCENLYLAKYDDWRLPNRNELQSIINYETALPAIEAMISPTEGEGARDYWSSTTIVEDTDLAWVMGSDYGTISEEFKTYNAFVRCVRGGKGSNVVLKPKSMPWLLLLFHD